MNRLAGFLAIVAAATAFGASASEPRELLQLFDMDEAFFATFVDGQPVSPSETDSALRVLGRLARTSLEDIDAWSKKAKPIRPATEKPAAQRGELFDISGRARRLVVEPLSPEQLERLDAPRLYRCQIDVDGLTVEVLAPQAPAAWPLDKPLDEPVRVRGIWLKLAAPASDGQGTASPLLAARRIEWYPATTLGRLGMDVGLLDLVRDREPLSDDDREAFYQMLAAVGRAKEDALEATAEAQLARQAQDLTAKLAEPKLNDTDRTRAKRSLALASRGRTDVEPLFNRPAEMRAALVTIEGTAYRAIEIRVEAPDIVQRLGIRRYYEVEVVTSDSQNYPLVICLRELPPGMPQGDNIHEQIRAVGFFYKSWMYRSHRPAPAGAGGEPGRDLQLAPLIIARSAKWLPNSAASGMLSAGAIVGLVVAGASLAGFLLWRFTRGDRAARQSLKSRFELPDGASLDRLGR